MIQILSRTVRVASTICLLAVGAFSADTSRNWQPGTLLETEKQQVPQGSTKTSNTEGTAKDKGNKTDYSQTTTSTTTQDYDNFQVYTIRGDNKTYVARERLLFPWSKPANVTVGEKVKYAISKHTLYLLDDDGKQHKAGISKVSVNAPE
ncbi:MAG: hypothetical protein JO108_14680 [Acidobacteriaceae bacterium]|nr:hypothetical protein [Acidobacteriaceae bacterium]